MSRSIVIIMFLSGVAAGSALTLLVNDFTRPAKPTASDEPRVAREKFFGAGNELPPVEKGQEMRPRW